MLEIVVTNTNIIVEAPRPRPRRRRRPPTPAAMLELAGQLRQAVEQVCCTSSWADDCLYRGVDYVPDFRCSCSQCRSEFPHRLHPRPPRETSISIDCQIEAETDLELAEDLARLRNDRERVGVAFIANNQHQRRDDRRRRSH